MPTSRPSLTGTRIRARRNLRGMRQADLARAVGVSPSYLNLIEHNRRKVGATLLASLAEALGVSVDALTDDVDGKLVAGARAAAQRSEARAQELERIEEFTGRFPGWAGVLAETQARVERLERVVEQLNDRMTHDPYMGEALHEIISAVTSVQSTASILSESGAIEPEWQARFHHNILQDSTRLADGAVALVNYLDSEKIEETGLAAPQEEVEAWLERHGFHLPDIEGGAPDARAMVRGQAELASEASRLLAQQWIARFAADAAALPMAPLMQALTREGLAPEVLASAFGVPFDQVLRRLALLPAPALAQAGLPPMGLVICDLSGTLLFRRPVEGFALPRFGGACPLWPLYQALITPYRPIRRALVTAGQAGRRVMAYAYASHPAPPGLDAPMIVQSTMLIAADAVPGPYSPQPVGASCRTCAQAACPARREPSILSSVGDGLA